MLEREVYYSLPFLFLFQAGFGYVGLKSVWEGLRETWGRLRIPAAAQADVDA